MMKVIGLGRTTSALLAGVLLSGCCIGRLQLTVTAAPHSNGDRPVYVLVAEVDAGREAVLVNLASEEYFKSVQAAKLKGRLLNVSFEDWKAGRYKIISFYAKRARGLMARHAIVHGVEDVEQLKAFNADGYAFAAEASDDGRWVFRRRQD